jgi:hypothetical protein
MKNLLMITFILIFSFEAFGMRRARSYNPSDLYRQNRCTEWANLHKARAQKGDVAPILTVAFEGLWSYRSRSTKRFYDYQQGTRRSSRIRGGGAFLVKKFLSKLPKGSSEFLVLSHSTYRSSAARGKMINCLRAFKRVNPRVTLNLVGHSFGGAAAKTLERDLANRNIDVNHTMSFDPRDWRRLSNITYDCFSETCNNYRQRRPLVGASMRESRGAVDTDATRAGLGHGGIPGYRPALARYKEVLANN